jgi:hypothetical protein
MLVYKLLNINKFYQYHCSSNNDLFHKMWAQLVIERPSIDRFQIGYMYIGFD